MQFYIVTPSFNQVDFLKHCVASVRDQVTVVSRERGAGIGTGYSNKLSTTISVHHHVQDGGSADGTVEWLRAYIAKHPPLENYKLTFDSETDEGMYDAINLGWNRAPGNVDIVAYLNCDEQYLPEALYQVAQWFDAHSGKDVVFGNVVVIDETGAFVCCRKVVPPFKWHIMTDHLPIFTAATFIRIDALKDHTLFFDIKWRVIGDVAWVLKMLNRHIQFGILNRYLTAFTDAGGNLSLGELAETEKRMMRAQTPKIVQGIWPVWGLIHRIRKLFSGGYWQRPFGYAVYRPGSLERETMQVAKPETRWISRLQLNR